MTDNTPKEKATAAPKKPRRQLLPNGEEQLFMPDWLMQGTFNAVRIEEQPEPSPKRKTK